jgi:hypothetical protein
MNKFYRNAEMHKAKAIILYITRKVIFECVMVADAREVSYEKNCSPFVIRISLVR